MKQLDLIFFRMPQDANPSRLWLLPARRVEALVGYLRHRHLRVNFFLDLEILGILGRKWVRPVRGNTTTTGSGGWATSSYFNGII